MRESPKPLLQLQQARKTYVRAGFTIAALQGFSLHLVPGEFVGLLGPNGSGKTTLVKVITGLCDADGGELRWRDQPAQAAGRPGPHLADLGVLIEGRGAAYERLTTLENARYFCGLRERPFDRSHFDALALLLNLPDVHAPVRQLSTGNKLRAGLLCTLIHRPALVLLDEPTLGLDLLSRKAFYEMLIDEWCDGERSVLVSTHQVEEVESLLSDVLMLNEGRLVLSISLEEVDRRFVALSHDPAVAEQVAAAHPLLRYRVQGSAAALFDGEPPPSVQALGRRMRPSLVDLFVALTRKPELDRQHF